MDSFPSIIRKPDASGFSETTTGKNRITRFDDGSISTRPKARFATVTMKLSWHSLPQSEYEALAEFFASHAGMPFLYTPPESFSPIKCRFLDEELDFIAIRGMNGGYRWKGNVSIVTQEDFAVQGVVVYDSEGGIVSSAAVYDAKVSSGQSAVIRSGGVLTGDADGALVSVLSGGKISGACLSNTIIDVKAYGDVVSTVNYGGVLANGFSTSSGGMLGKDGYLFNGADVTTLHGSGSGHISAGQKGRGIYIHSGAQCFVENGGNAEAMHIENTANLHIEKRGYVSGAEGGNVIVKGKLCAQTGGNVSVMSGGKAYDVGGESASVSVMSGGKAYRISAGNISVGNGAILEDAKVVTTLVADGQYAVSGCSIMSGASALFGEDGNVVGLIPMPGAEVNGFVHGEGENIPLPKNFIASGAHIADGKSAVVYGGQYLSNTMINGYFNPREGYWGSGFSANDVVSSGNLHIGSAVANEGGVLYEGQRIDVIDGSFHIILSGGEIGSMTNAYGDVSGYGTIDEINASGTVSIGDGVICGNVNVGNANISGHITQQANFNLGHQQIFSGAKIESLVVSSGASTYAYGGIIGEAKVRDGGTLSAYSGLSILSASIESGGSLRADEGAVFSKCKMLAGAKVNNFTLRIANEDISVISSADVKAGDHSTDVAGVYSPISSAYNIRVSSGGTLFVDALASSVVVLSGGVIEIGSYGNVKDIMMSGAAGCRLSMYTGASCSLLSATQYGSANIEYGDMFHSSASYVGRISKGNLRCDLDEDGRGFTLNILSGATAASGTFAGGKIVASDSATKLTNISLTSGATCSVLSGVSATINSMENGTLFAERYSLVGAAHVQSGSYAEVKAMGNCGTLTVYANGSAAVNAGGSATTASVKSGGTLTLHSGSIVGSVSSETDATLIDLR